MTVLVGHCSGRDEAVAYLPFVEVLEIPIVPTRRARCSPRSGAEGVKDSSLIGVLTSCADEGSLPMRIEQIAFIRDTLDLRNSE